MPKAVICPFFHSERRLKVKCEAGGVSFSAPDERRRFLERYCCSADGWAGCTLAKTAEERKPD